MGFLDANIPGLTQGESTLGEKFASYMQLGSQASGEMSAARMNAGEAADALQVFGLRFDEILSKQSQLIQIAQQNFGDAITTYVAQDSQAANATSAVIGALPHQ